MLKKAQKFMLTKQGLKVLKAEYDELIQVKRPQVTKRIQRAREFGDLSENSEYDAAKDEQVLIENRIAKLEEILHKVRIIKPNNRSDFVTIGSTVEVQAEGVNEEFMIVGTVEADPAKKKISNESPVGAAILGAKVGDEIEVATPLVRAKYKILKIK